MAKSGSPESAPARDDAQENRQNETRPSLAERLESLCFAQRHRRGFTGNVFPYPAIYIQKHRSTPGNDFQNRFSQNPRQLLRRPEGPPVYGRIASNARGNAPPAVSIFSLIPRNGRSPRARASGEAPRNTPSCFISTHKKNYPCPLRYANLVFRASRSI